MLASSSQTRTLVRFMPFMCHVLGVPWSVGLRVVMNGWCGVELDPDMQRANVFDRVASPFQMASRISKLQEEHLRGKGSDRIRWRTGRPSHD